MKELLEAKKQLHDLTEKSDRCIRYVFDPRFTDNIHSFEPRYRFFWEKYNINKNQYQKDFLQVSVKYAKLVDASNKFYKEMNDLIEPYGDRQDKLCQKVRELEKKYSHTSKILKEKCKLRDEIRVIFDMIKQGAQKYVEHARKDSVALNKFLQNWIKYSEDPKYEQEFLDSSNEYVKCWIEFTAVEMEYFDWRFRSLYDKKISEITNRFAELDGQLQ